MSKTGTCFMVLSGGKAFASEKDASAYARSVADAGETVYIVPATACKPDPVPHPLDRKKNDEA
jgi:hypothetical protein